MSEIRKLPLLPLRGMIVFPFMIIHLDVGRERSVAALEEAMVRDRQILLVAQKNAETDEPGEKDLYDVGTIAEVRQLLKLPGGALRVLVEGQKRAAIEAYEELETFAEVTVVEYAEVVEESMEMEALTRAVVHEFEQWVKLSKKIPAETLVSVAILDDAGRLGDLIASHLSLKVEDRQALLEQVNIKNRMELLYKILARELEVLEMERKIGMRVRKQMEKIQKDYYLREQIKAIQKELGDEDDKAADIEAYRKKLAEGSYPEDVQKTIKKEIHRMEGQASMSAEMGVIRTQKTIEKEIHRMEGQASMSAEMGVIRTYIETLLELPWMISSEDNIDIKAAETVLNEDHYGLKKVKERILEYLAVHQLTKEQHAPILCLVGPPGVGKTSLAS